jgi:hypothetical protein
MTTCSRCSLTFQRVCFLSIINHLGTGHLLVLKWISLFILKICTLEAISSILRWFWVFQTHFSWLNCERIPGRMGCPWFRVFLRSMRIIHGHDLHISFFVSRILLIMRIDWFLLILCMFCMSVVRVDMRSSLCINISLIVVLFFIMVFLSPLLHLDLEFLILIHICFNSVKMFLIFEFSIILLLKFVIIYWIKSGRLIKHEKYREVFISRQVCRVFRLQRQGTLQTYTIVIGFKPKSTCPPQPKQSLSFTVEQRCSWSSLLSVEIDSAREGYEIAVSNSRYVRWPAKEDTAILAWNN